MADSFRCPVCLQPFDVDQVLPRLFPCTHSVCESCLREIMKKRFVICPVCRKRHAFQKGVSSFPENRYVLDALKDTSPIEQCKDHKRPLSLYCQDCKKDICQMCLLKWHNTHDAFDVLEKEEAKVKNFIGCLEYCRDDWRVKRQNVEKEYADKVEKIRSFKRQQMKIFDDLIETTSRQKSDFSAQVSAKIRIISENIVKLKRVGELKSPAEMKEGYLAVERDATKVLQKRVTYKFYGSIQNQALQCEDICGQLQENSLHVDAPVETSTDRPCENTFKHIRPHFRFEGEAVALETLCNDTFVVGLASGDIKSICWIVQYDMTGIQIDKVECKPYATSMTKVQFRNTKCLALSLREEERIDFFDINNLRTRLYIFDAKDSVPTFVTTSSSDDQSIIFANGRYFASILDCQTLAVGATVSMVYTVEDLACVGEGSEELVVIVTWAGLFAYNMQSQKLMWRIDGKVPGLETRTIPSRVVSDGKANIYVLDEMKAVHKFSKDGKYVSTFVNQGEHGIGEVHQMAFNKADSSLLVLHKLTDKYSITAVKV